MNTERIIFIFVVIISVIILFFGLFSSIPIIYEIITHPVETSHIQKIHLQYPDPTTSLPVYVNADNSVEILSIFSIDLFLTYDEPLIERTNVSIKGVGYLYPRGQRIIGNMMDTNTNTSYTQHIIVGFEGASEIDNTEKIYKNPNGQFIVFLQNETRLKAAKDEDYKSLPILSNIFWDTQGDFSPYVLFPDSKSESMIPISFNKKIHVGGSEVLRQERYSKINTLISIILIWFGTIFPIVFLYYEYRKLSQEK